MIARPATPEDLRYVIAHLRPHCRREAFCARPENFTAAALQAEMVALGRYALIEAALLPDEQSPPAAIFTAYRGAPAVAVFRVLSTDNWPAVAGHYPRWMLRHVGPVLRGAGCHMAEFNVLADPPPNYRWFALMGARPAGPPLPRGRNREPYQTLVVIDGEWPALSSAPIGLASLAGETVAIQGD